MKRLVLSFVSLALFVVVGAPSGALQAAPRKPGLDPAALDRVINRVRTEYGLVGLGVAVIESKKLRYAKGFGLRDRERKLPVTADTLFAIGSTTKAFTAMLLGMLVDEGKLAWDKPVRTFLPEFQLKDRFASERITPLDLLLHNSGLPRHDLVWYGGNASRRQLVRRLRYLQPSADFRQRFQYNNLMFMVAGYLAGVVAQSSWEKLIRTRILAPLGMVRSCLSHRDAQRDPNHAEPYGARIKGVRPHIPFRPIDAVAPAGSLLVSVKEMARWLGFLLDRGVVGKKRLIKLGTLKRLASVGMLIPESTPSPVPAIRRALAMLGYAPGWLVIQYRGYRIYLHDGGIDGFRARVAVIPELGHGLVIFSNNDGLASVANKKIFWTIIDQLLGGEPLPWAAHFAAADKRRQAMMKKALERVARFKGVPNTKPTHPLDAYVGRYREPGYGVVRIEKKGGGLELSYHTMRFRLKHVHYNLFRLVNDKPANRYMLLTVNFRVDPRGRIGSFEVPLEGALREPMRFVHLKK